MSKLLVILCTAPAEGDTAHKLARGLVQAKLAACVNIVPGLTSCYSWQGKIETDPEVQLIIKTSAERWEAVRDWIGDNHPYDTPEIIALPVAHCAEKYQAWLLEQTEA